MRNDDAKSAGVRVVVVSGPLVFTDQQVVWGRRGGRLVVSVARVRRLRGVVRTALHHFLDVLRLHVDRHRADDAARRWTRRRLKPHRTRVSHTYVQLPQRL